LVIGWLLILILASNLLRLFHLHHLIRGSTQKAIFLSEDLRSPGFALKTLSANTIAGRVFNNDLFGGYILWHYYPKIKPFVDGRQINKTAYEKYLWILLKPAQYWPLAQAEFDFDFVLLSTDNPVNRHVIPYLIHHPDWQLVYLRVPQIAWVRKGRFRLPPEMDGFARSLRSVEISPSEIRRILTQTPTAPQPPSGFLKRYLFPPAAYIDSLDQGLTLYDLGFRAAGLAQLLKTFEFENAPDIRAILTAVLEDFVRWKGSDASGR